MPLNKQIFLLYLAVISLTPTQIDAQNLGNNNAPIITSKGLKKEESTSTSTLTSDAARKNLMYSSKIFGDFSAVLDSIAIKELSGKKTYFESVAEASIPNYKIYAHKVDSLQHKRMDNISDSPTKSVEQNQWAKRMNMLKSAQCFTTKETGRYIITKDMEGNEIVAYPLDSLRKNPRYGVIDNYKEGFARVQKDLVFGYINFCGEEVITCQYDKAFAFNNGRALVHRVNWFFIDGEGHESPALENVTDAKALENGISLLKFKNNTAALSTNDFGSNKGFASLVYESIEPFNKKNNIFKARLGKKVGIIDLVGKVKLDVNYDDVNPTNDTNICRITLAGKVGLVDSDWKIQFTPNFLSISDFNEYGIAEAKNDLGVVLIKKQDFSTSKTFTSISSFNEFGVAVIQDANKNFGLIDSTLRVILDPKYASIGTFNELGLAPVSNATGKWGFVKYDGIESVKPSYESVKNFNTQGFAIVQTLSPLSKSKKGVPIVIDIQGNTIIPVSDEAIEKKYSYQLSDTVHSENYYVVYVYSENNRATPSLHLIQKDSKQLLNTTPYQRILTGDNQGHFCVQKNNLWGIIDTSGKVLVNCDYNQIRPLSEDFYAAENALNKWGFLNSKGEQLIPHEYDEVKNFHNSFAIVSKGKNKWGLISKFNAKVAPCAFKSIVEKDAKFEATDIKGHTYMINEKGECETDCAKFEAIRTEANKPSTEQDAPIKK